MNLEQLDVTDAFLHETWKKCIWKFPRLYPWIYKRNVRKLKKALYGLKQSPEHKPWLTLVINRVMDNCLYSLCGLYSHRMWRKYQTWRYDYQKNLISKSSVNWDTSWVLRWQKMYAIKQKYVINSLTETGMLGCKPANTPIEMNYNYVVMKENQLTKRRIRN